jgi:hypothetical protein
MRNRPSLPLRSTLIALAFSLLAPSVFAESHKPSDYPLRVHIYRMNRRTERYRGVVQYVEGEGRGNLFENGDPRGFDFAFNCNDRFMTSSGFETYFAKWKKPGQSLVLLLREIGSNSTETCELKVDMKDFAYVSHDGVLQTEPSSVFKDWMAKHQYDPEQGKNEPLYLPKPSAPPPPPSNSPSQDPQ